jgi:PAS domain S-box-containing protein
MNDTDKTKEVLIQELQKYRAIFQDVRVSIWVEDFSEVKVMLDKLKAQGVEDVEQHLAQNQATLFEAVGKIKIVDINEQSVKMFGAKDKSELLESLHNVFLPETLALLPAQLAAVVTGAPYYEAENVVQTLQGKRFDVLFSIVYPPPDSDYSQVIVSLIDITRRKQIAERELVIMNAMVENARDAMGVSDPQGDLLYINQAYYEVFGYEYEQHELQGQSVTILYRPEDLPLLNEEIVPQLMAGETWNGELTCLRKDGSTVEVDMTVYPIYTTGQELIGLAAVIRDISERKREQAERERLQQELIEAQRHAIQELSTPIIPIMEGIIILPLVGSIDSARARDITRSLLAGIRQHRAQVVIIDITGVSVVDSGVASNLDKTIQAARLKGAQTIITGISDAVAETVVDLGIDWSKLQTVQNLQTGLAVALRRMGKNL